MLEDYVMEVRDYSKIEKLRSLHNIDTFWEDVKRLTKNVRSDHSLRRWCILSEARYGELLEAKKSFYED